MVPESLLPILLGRIFPVIDGPEDLDRVEKLADSRGAEFCACPRLDPEMVSLVCRAGFLPMSEDFTGHDVLLVKVHEERCLLDPRAVHVSRSTRRRARGLVMRIDAAFERCLDAIVAHHPDRWLTERLNAALSELHVKPRHGVQTHSVEVYEGPTLVAGEVGYACGGVYTSLSGFHAASGSGTVQLAALGRVLAAAGFDWWDLGMVIEYKLDLGARAYERDEFLRRYRAASRGPQPELPSRVDCEAVLRPYPSSG